MVLASAALAQDADKPAQGTDKPKAGVQTPAKPAAKADDKSDDKADAPAKAAPNWPYLSVGWSDWRLNGNEHKFLQYATPPRGFYLGQLLWEPYSSDGRHWGVFDLRTPGQDDYRVNGRVQLFNGSFNGEFSDSRSKFFATTPQIVDESQHEITEAYLKQKIGQNFAITFRNRFDQKEYYEQAPTDPENQRTRYWDVAARGSIGANGFLDLNYSDIRYWDRTQVEPDSDTRRISATYRHELTDNLSLEGSYSHSTIDQDGLSQSKIDSWRLGGRWAPTQSTSVLLNFRQDKLNLPNVQNAYDRARTSWDARVVQNLTRGWSGQLGYSQLDLERYRGDQTYVDVPRIHTFDGRVSGPINPDFRFTLKALRQTLDGQAVMTDIHKTDTAYFRNRWKVQAKVDTTSEFINTYFVYTYNVNENDVRGLNIGDTGWTVGASWQAKPNLDFYAEFSTDRWSASSANSRTADTIGGYWPDGSTWTMGANYVVNKKVSLAAGYTAVVTRNANLLLLPDGNIHGNYFNGTLTYKDPHGWDVVVSYAPFGYHDQVYDLMNYASGLISISANTKF